MLLCDAAQVADGKLYILGGGWSMTGPDPVPSAVALKIEVDWHEAGVGHHWELFLEDADGRPVMVDTPEGSQPVEVRGEFTVAQPPGDPRGVPDRRGAGGQPRADPARARDPLRLAPDHRRRGPGGRLGRVHHPAPPARFLTTMRRAPSVAPSKEHALHDDLRPTVRALLRGLRGRRRLPPLAGQDDHRVRRPPVLHDHHEPPPAAHQRLVRRARHGPGPQRRRRATSCTRSPSG